MAMIITIMGSAVVIKPKALKRIIKFWKKDDRIYIAGSTKLIFGVIFLLASPQCRYPVTIYILGVLIALSAVLIFVLGPAKINPMLNKWEKKPSRSMCLIGIVVVVVGVLLLYSI